MAGRTNAAGTATRPPPPVVRTREASVLLPWVATVAATVVGGLIVHAITNRNKR